MTSMQSEAPLYLIETPHLYEFVDLHALCGDGTSDTIHPASGMNQVESGHNYSLLNPSSSSSASTVSPSSWVASNDSLPLFSTPSESINDPSLQRLVSCGNSHDRDRGGLAVEAGDEMQRLQRDLSLQPSSNNNNSSSSSSGAIDTYTDFSFLHRRPASSCSSSMKQYIHSSANSSAGATEVTITPDGTPKKGEKASYAAVRSERGTPTPKSTVRHTLKSRSPYKMTPERLVQRRQAPVGGESVRSKSGAPMRGNVSIFANTKRLPLRLPSPPLCLISDPYADLCMHLKRHGMDLEAQEFASATGITADFALRGWIQTSEGGAIGLLNQTNTFLDRHASIVKTQIETTKQMVKNLILPQIVIPVTDLDAHADEQCLTPTHILAIHGSGSISRERSREEEAKGILIPCHSLMYALQCVSLPAFATSSSRQEGETHRILPVLPLRIPRPSEYPTLHRFIYTHDTGALLMELLPMKHIARHWDHLQATKGGQQEGSYMLPTDMTAPSSATDALSHLPSQTLLGYAYKIHSGWANGVAIGFLEAKYWSTLDRAWNLITAALSIKKARIMNPDMAHP
ncbi:hypothetical protein CBS101457_003488 [Exobasidium rhododendri]|nr:hypothetical protein CBS101457_003488 [Exobasidium rhododendri]